MGLIEKQKVYALIVQDEDLVVFEQPDFPSAGIQVPGGTVEAGETLDAAVLREAYEETGLEGLQIVRYLGKQERDMRDYGKAEFHHRHFFYLMCENSIPKQWDAVEQTPSDGSAPIRFAFYRARIESLPVLIAEMDRFVPALRQILAG
jgi:ADP-ribose pyrophosphatase YjhB (NUDIX family)